MNPLRAKFRWLLFPLVGLLLAGIGICLYLTRFHDIEMYGDQSATLSNCPQTETTNCEVVNTSGYAEFLGVPISALGIPTYLLLLLLSLGGWRNPRLLTYAFAIGLLTVAYSVYLYYISTVKIGYLCDWCFRLYCINAGIALLCGIAAWRNPLGLLRDVFADLSHPPRELRMAAAAFAGMLVLTVAGERAYRSALTRVPTSSVMAASSSMPVAGTPFQASSSLAEFSVREGKLQLEPFDLNGRLGKGKPLALIFWQPGVRVSEEGLVSFARFLKEQAPQVDAFAVVGGGPEERAEIAWEAFCLLGVPPDLRLLRDEGFALFKQLALPGFPTLALLDGRGVLVSARIQGLRQSIAGAAGGMDAEALIRQVAGGSSPATAPALLPYYPSSELYGHCAPSFHLPELFSGKDRLFTPRSENGKPTFLMFWSSTCKHCQKEIPQLVEYLKKHPGEFNLISVALIRPGVSDGFNHRKVTEAYVRTNQLTWPVLDDSSGFASDLYRVTSTPTTFLITAAGQVAGAWYHPHEKLETALNPAIAKLAQVGGACTPFLPDPAKRASFSVAAPDGSQVSIDTLANRPTVLHFWATWCAPCQAELPSLLKFRKTLARQGGQVVLVSVEDADAAGRVMKYGSNLASGFESFLAPREGLAQRLDLSYSVPRTYLLAGGGEVLRTYRGAQPWEDPLFERSVMTLLQLPAR
ncbi:MAG: redoxin domain-containing protein [Acidobacteria bacterium]|nr:redoxin domain-containing protein [Acidobacteriota bacterium]